MVHSTCSRRVARVTALARSARSILPGLIFLLSAVCAAQQLNPQFPQPLVYITGGQVNNFVTDPIQVPPASGPDILYLNAATTSGGVSSVTG